MSDPSDPNDPNDPNDPDVDPSDAAAEDHAVPAQRTTPEELIERHPTLSHELAVGGDELAGCVDFVS